MRERGFSLIELMVAGTISLVVVAAAFAFITRASEASAAQERATELTSRGRIALDLIGRDIRSAGDSVQLLPDPCLGAGAPFGCAAILEPHPWRITIARYAWGAGPDGILGTADDVLPSGPFAANGDNVVTYQFVPRTAGPVSLGGTRTGYVGRLERISNPFSFGDRHPGSRCSSTTWWSTTRCAPARTASPSTTAGTTRSSSIR
ncbi:PilW family protein [Vulgatibacter incomptus]|uniref:Prepilin-type N-terminal cleavage/methylation domain-containing protein n=1 Tax=Vulgatibacter incomptus TaxID=1391653 RepID=A0A0K1PE84_9BACT|nr:type II secretion system protein [Vulgatibacter incomptus]AKU91711.1 hypothetical protein AKJ08_2098 [Vulgatibacter incomptus]